MTERAASARGRLLGRVRRDGRDGDVAQLSFELFRVESGASLGPVGGGQLEEAITRPVGHDADHLGEVVLGIEAVKLAARDERVEVGSSLGGVVGAEEKEGFSAGGDDPERIFAQVVIHAQTPVVEEAAKSELLPAGVADGLLDEAAHLRRGVVLSTDPLEELVDERSEDGPALLESSSGRQVSPALVELIEVANSEQAFATDSEAGDGGFPEAPPDVPLIRSTG